MIWYDILWYFMIWCDMIPGYLCIPHQQSSCTAGATFGGERALWASASASAGCVAGCRYSTFLPILLHPVCSLSSGVFNSEMEKVRVQGWGCRWSGTGTEMYGKYLFISLNHHAMMRRSQVPIQRGGTCTVSGLFGGVVMWCEVWQYETGRG